MHPFSLCLALAWGTWLGCCLSWSLSLESRGGGAAVARGKCAPLLGRLDLML